MDPELPSKDAETLMVGWVGTLPIAFAGSGALIGYAVARIVSLDVAIGVWSGFAVMAHTFIRR